MVEGVSGAATRVFKAAACRIRGQLECAGHGRQWILGPGSILSRMLGSCGLGERVRLGHV
eukprot:9478672-Pyramimonas_sp.AAC.1